MTSVVVTGASSGLGEASARALARRGARVFGGVRDAAAAARLREAGVEPLLLDVTSAEGVAAARAAVEERVGAGGLDVLVNNAGVAVAAPLEATPLDELRRQVDVNLVGVLATTRAFLPLLRRARGRIVNVGSGSGRDASPFIATYVATKFALVGLSDALRLELEGTGVSVALVEPGPVHTPLWPRVIADCAARRAALDPSLGAAYGAAWARFEELLGFAARHASPVDAVAAEIVRVALD